VASTSGPRHIPHPLPWSLLTQSRKGVVYLTPLEKPVPPHAVPQRSTKGLPPQANWCAAGMGDTQIAYLRLNLTAMAQICRRRLTGMPPTPWTTGLPAARGGVCIARIRPRGRRELSAIRLLLSQNRQAHLAAMTPHSSPTATRGVDEGPTATILVGPSGCAGGRL
jgi:hypothetical protein